MPNLSDYDLKQMDEVWQGKLSEPKVRTLLKRTLEDLRVARDRLNQNPGNSSRPPGSMPPWQSGDTKAKDTEQALADEQDVEDDELTASELAKGTQPTSDDNAAKASADAMPGTSVPATPKRAGRPLGAPGYGRTQKLSPTKFIYKHPEACAACLHPFQTDDPAAQAWTAWDTVELCALHQSDTSAPQLGVCLEVTRHYLMQHQCNCGHITRAIAWRADADSLWEGVNIGEQRLLGHRLAATVVYLSLRMRLPRLKVQELLLELFGLELSTALIDQTIKQAARSVEPLQPELVRQLQEAVLAHADETSWPERKLRLWLWVFCCSHTVLYVIGMRTKEMFDSVLGEFMGTLMSDGYMAYRSTLDRLRCWAHLKRKLCGVAESTDQYAALGGRGMLDLFKSLMQAVFETRDKLLAMPAEVQHDPPALPVVTHAKQIEELKALCEKYRDAKHEALRAIAREFLNDWDVIMRVLGDPLLPLTNNAAERQLRHWVIARRVSFGTRNLVGSNSLALLASVIDTCRARKASATDLLARAIHAARLGLPAPALPPIPTHLLGRHGALVGM